MKEKLNNQPKQFYKLAISLILAIFISTALIRPAAGKEVNVNFGETKIENHFPKGLRFSVKIDLIQTKGAHINLWYRLGADSWMQKSPNCDVKITDESANSKYFSCVILLELLGVPPQLPITYKWELADPNDNPIKFSDEKVIIYSDTKFNWQNLDSDTITIWWHDRPSEFAQQILSTAQTAIQQQKAFYGVELEHPIQIVLQNSVEELYMWREKTSQSIGGEAFPRIGLTIQIVELDMPKDVVDSWLNEIVPHEISHLYFFQATAREKAIPPNWLNEGMAGYNEISDHSQDWFFVRRAIKQQTIIPLGELRGEFTGEEEKIFLSYAESTTAIIYAIEIYGQEGLKKLFSAYQAGESSDEAFLKAFGRTESDLEKDWEIWVVEQTNQPSNTIKVLSYVLFFLTIICSCTLASIFVIIFLIVAFNNKIKIQPVPRNMV